MDVNELYERGLKLRRQLFGSKAVEERMNALGEFGEPLQNIVNACAFKQPVIMVNRVDAGGAVGGAYVAKAPADGYHTLLNTVTHVLIPITENALGRATRTHRTTSSCWRGSPRIRCCSSCIPACRSSR